MANNFAPSRSLRTALLSPQGTRRLQFCSPEQQQAFEYGPHPLCLNGGFAAGKLLSLDTPIPTPTGWTLIGDLHTGDVILDERGQPCRIRQAHTPETPTRMFRLHFTGGTTIDAGGEHLWTTWTYHERKALRSVDGFPDDWPKWRAPRGVGAARGYSTGPRVRTTEEIFDTQRTSRSAGFFEAGHAIPNALALDLPTVPLPLDPYVLGAWLGDGTTINGSITTADPIIINTIRRRGFSAHQVPSSVRADNKSSLYRIDGFTHVLGALGLIGNKHVPAVYLRASIAQRLDLLRGLMDTDGTVSGNPRHAGCTFTSTVHNLALAVFEMVASLGMNPTITEGRARFYDQDCGPVWDVYFLPQIQPFLLERKAARVRAASFNRRRARFKYITLVEEITPRLSRCLTVDSPNSLYLAGRGMVPTHNTLCATRKILYISSLYPGNRGVIARRVGDELRKTTMPTFFKDCPPEAYMHGGRRADQEKILRLNPVRCDDGQLRSSEILFLHLDDPEIQHILRGLEINWFLLDQAEEMEEEMFDTLMKRLGRWDQAHVPEWLINDCHTAGYEWPFWNTASGLPAPGASPIPPTYPILTVNPDVETHWVWRRFHEDSDEYRERWSALGYKMLTLSPLDNRFLPRQNRDELLAADPEWQKRFVYGKWGTGGGTIHTVAPESVIEGTVDILEWIRATCTLHRILDHGDSSPTCCLWCAVDAAGNLYFYREYYRPNKLISDHRQAIVSMSEGERYTFNIADPSIFNPTLQRIGRESRFSVADEYGDTSSGVGPHTALFWSRGNNDEMGTRNRINEYLRVDPDRIHPFTKRRGSPRLFFIKRNREYPWGADRAIRETRSQRREKVGSENGKDLYSDDRDKNVPDHAYDPVRYLVASRPPIHAGIVRHSTRGTAIEARMKLKRRLRQDPRYREMMRRRLAG